MKFHTLRNGLWKWNLPVWTLGSILCGGTIIHGLPLEFWICIISTVMLTKFEVEGWPEDWQL